MKWALVSALAIFALLVLVLVLLLNYFGSSAPQTDYGASKTASSVFATNTAVEQAIRSTHLAQTSQARMTMSPTPLQSETN